MKKCHFIDYVYVETDEGEFEIEVEVSWEGYYQHAKVSGPPEDCYPEEGEMNLTAIEPADDLPPGITKDMFKEACSKADERLTDAAWEEYHAA